MWRRNLGNWGEFPPASCPENSETGAGEGSTGICGERTGVHAGWPGYDDLSCTSGRTRRPRGVAETLASNRTGADTAALPGTHRNGEFAGTSTVWSPGTDADTAAPDRDYGNGNLAAAPTSGNASYSIAVAAGSGSQGLDDDSVFFVWQTGPQGVFRVANRATGWAGARNWMKHPRTCCRDGRRRRWASITWCSPCVSGMPPGRETATDLGRGVYDSPLPRLRCFCPRLILMAAGGAKNMLAFPWHRGLLNGRCLDRAVAGRHDSPIGN